MATVDTQEYLDMVCGLLARGETSVLVPVAGTSMTPFLRPGDVAYLKAVDAPPRRGDIVLYRRPGGQYVLHRIHTVREEGWYEVVGDAQLVREPVKHSQLRAVMTGAGHGGRHLGPGSLRWRFFATVWLWLPLRRRAMWLHGKIKA